MSPSCATDVATHSPLASVAALQNEFGNSPYWALRQIRCGIDQDRVVPHGTVTSFYLKQIAQSIAARAVGQKDALGTESQRLCGLHAKRVQIAHRPRTAKSGTWQCVTRQERNEWVGRLD